MSRFPCEVEDDVDDDDVDHDESGADSEDNNNIYDEIEYKTSAYDATTNEHS